MSDMHMDYDILLYLHFHLLRTHKTARIAAIYSIENVFHPFAAKILYCLQILLYLQLDQYQACFERAHTADQDVKIAKNIARMHTFALFGGFLSSTYNKNPIKFCHFNLPSTTKFSPKDLSKVASCKHT